MEGRGGRRWPHLPNTRTVQQYMDEWRRKTPRGQLGFPKTRDEWREVEEFTDWRVRCDPWKKSWLWKTHVEERFQFTRSDETRSTSLCQTFFSTSMGTQIPVIVENPLVVCGCRKIFFFNPPRGVGFIPTITSTSGRLHSEFIRNLFWQDHRETDRFFTVSGVLSAQSDRGFFHYLRANFSSMFKSRVGNIPSGSTQRGETFLVGTLSIASYISKTCHLFCSSVRSFFVNFFFYYYY